MTEEQNKDSYVGLFQELRRQMQLDADAEAEAEMAKDMEDYEMLLTAHLKRGDDYKAEVIRLSKILDAIPGDQAEQIIDLLQGVVSELRNVNENLLRLRSP